MTKFQVDIRIANSFTVEANTIEEAKQIVSDMSDTEILSDSSFAFSNVEPLD